MKAKGTHEGCIEQIQRLFSERLYNGKDLTTDEVGRIRVDDWEMDAEIQAEVAKLWLEATTETLPNIGDLAGYRSDFLDLFGFENKAVDYSKEVNEMTDIPGLV